MNGNVAKDETMSAFTLARIIFALGVITATLQSFAQKFQDSTKEELQMTSDAKAPAHPLSCLIVSRQSTTRISSPRSTGVSRSSPRKRNICGSERLV